MNMSEEDAKFRIYLHMGYTEIIDFEASGKANFLRIGTRTRIKAERNS